MLSGMNQGDYESGMDALGHCMLSGMNISIVWAWMLQELCGHKTLHNYRS